MLKLTWTSRPLSINHALLSWTSTILIHQNTFFAFCYLLWENSSIKNSVKLTSLCLNKLPSTLPTPPFFLPHPFPTNPSKMSSRRMTDGEWLNMSSAKDPLILVVRWSICKNRSMMCASSIQEICPLLSKKQPSYIRTLSCLDRVSPQTPSLNKFLPNSFSAKVSLPLSSRNTPISFIFNVNLVVQFSMTKNP